MKATRILQSVSVAALAVALTTSAVAQDEADAEPERIIVTAQKREQTLQEVPVALSVIDSATVDRQFTTSIESLQRLAPSVNFRKGSTNVNSALTIRGIGTVSFSGAIEPSVATVVDGVVLGRSGQAFNGLYDIERIEVLRGPQGTLFGKNASAGVVNIITKRPSDSFEAQGSATYFEDNEYILNGRISGPLSDTVSGSLSVLQSGFDGNVRNVFTNEDVNGYQNFGLRGMLEFEPSDDFSVLAIAEYLESDDDCCTDLELLPNGRNVGSPAAPDSQGIVNGVADLDLDQRLVDHDLVTRQTNETRAFSIEVNKGLWGGHTLTSISGYREWDNVEIREGDFTSVGGTLPEPVFGAPFLLHDDGSVAVRTLTQEIRLASAGDQRLDYILGAFYFDNERDSEFTRLASCQNNGGQNQDILDANPGLECNSDDLVSATAFARVRTENFALFGDADFDVLAGLNVFAGFRYTDDETSFVNTRRNNDEFGRQGVGVRPALPNSQFSEASGGFDNTFTGSVDDTDFSIRAGVRSTIGEFFGGRNLGDAYFSYTEGYKGPGFNVFFNQGAVDAAPIDAETVASLELGYKIDLGNLVASVALYDADIEDFQANNFDNSTGVTITRLTNAGDVTTRGFELDLLYTPIDNLNLTAAFAYNEAEIDSFNRPLDPTTGLPEPGSSDLSGADLLFSPDFNYTLGANYNFQLTEDIRVLFDTVVTHVDEQQSGLPNSNSGDPGVPLFNPALLLPDYTLWDLQVGFEFQDNYRLTFIGKNLTDESFATTFSGDGFRYQVPRDADRRFGVNFTATF